MPELVCNTSPFQYLHQLGELRILPALAGHVTVPPAVVEELNAGRRLGFDLPDLTSLDWVSVRSPKSAAAIPLVSDLGRGETEVLMLALETPGTVAVLDDGVARNVAQMIGVAFTGTLGLLVDAKHRGLVRGVEPLLDRLDTLGFRLASSVRAAVLRMAGETP